MTNPRLSAAKVAAELARYITAHPARPFDVATANCCHFAGGWFAHITGQELSALMPATPDVRAVVRLVREHGDWPELIGARLQRQRIPALLAATGDLVLLSTPRMDAELPETGFGMGICSGVHVIAVGGGQYQFCDKADALCAWRLQA